MCRSAILTSEGNFSAETVSSFFSIRLARDYSPSSRLSPLSFSFAIYLYFVPFLTSSYMHTHTRMDVTYVVERTLSPSLSLLCRCIARFYSYKTFSCSFSLLSLSLFLFCPLPSSAMVFPTTSVIPFHSLCLPLFWHTFV